MIIESTGFSTASAVPLLHAVGHVAPRALARPATSIDWRSSDTDESRPSSGRERLEVTDARIHLSAIHEPGTAAYGTLTNETTSTATLVGLDCPAFDRVVMRESVAIGNVPVLREIRSLTVLAGDDIAFRPGGRYLWMTGPRRVLEAGQLLGITMIFASGRRRVVPFRIVTNAASQDPAP